MKLKFYIVDVFAEARYSGNQLAVFQNAGRLQEGEMQQIAREMNYSETTFIVSDKMRDNGYKIRIFTPEREVQFAGHPVIGTAYVIQQQVVKKTIKKVKLNLGAGQVSVAIKYRDGDTEMVWMKQSAPVFGDIFDIKEVADVLNLEPAVIDERYPIQDVSTGFPFIIVPLKTMNDVRAARIDRDKYYSLIKGISAKAIFIFSPETYETENDLNARMFADYYGIPEDPATGSANGCLAAYLTKYKYFGEESINIRVEQGYEIGRPSLLYLRAEETDGQIEVHVGGKVVMVAQGEFI
jgi:trans-2,3-dihydro-3-hydroxyanthranilate isomerase